MSRDPHDEFHDLFNLIEERRLETQEEIKILHKRITEDNKEIIKEIGDLKNCVRNHTSHEETALHSIDKRLTNLEKSKWMIMGGGAAVAGLIIYLSDIKEFLT